LRTSWIDKHRPMNAYGWMAQCAVASGAILLVMLGMNAVLRTSLVSSIGATTFVAFAMPRTPAAQNRAIIGGYLLGTLIGIVFSLLLSVTSFVDGCWLQKLVVYALAAAAVGSTMLAMVATNTEHPPAAGLALGYVLDPWDGRTVVAVLAAAVILCVIRQLMGNRLMDLHGESAANASPDPVPPERERR